MRFNTKLFSVRISPALEAGLRKLAAEETERRQERVTPSDLVRDQIRKLVKRAQATA